MIDNILNFEFTSMMGILLYWVPASFCIFGYSVRTWTNYQKDIAKREKETGENSFYFPTDRIGDLIGRAFISVLPVGNLWAALFDVAPRLFSKLFNIIGVVFDQPIVPSRKK